jgi:hypothetical protein
MILIIISPDQNQKLLLNVSIALFINSAYQPKINMTTDKKLGIWMDHANAHLMEFTADPAHTKTITSTFIHEHKESTLSKGETQMHNKEQHQQADYYKKLGEVIRNYKDVILFGPTDAKVELFNILRADHRFAEIKIAVKQADKLSDNQQHQFVREHFALKSISAQ